MQRDAIRCHLEVVQAWHAHALGAQGPLQELVQVKPAALNAPVPL